MVTLDDYADYMVSSQEVEPGAGWDYGFLEKYNSTSDPVEISKAIIDTYNDFYEKNASTFSNPLVTLSCVDLGKTEQVVEKMSTLFTSLDAGLEQE